MQRAERVCLWGAIALLAAGLWWLAAGRTTAPTGTATAPVSDRVATRFVGLEDRITRLEARLAAARRVEAEPSKRVEPQPDLDEAQDLLRRIATLEARLPVDPKLASALASAIVDGNLPRVAELLEQTGTEALDAFGRPPLVTAAIHGQGDVVAHLLASGADLEARSQDRSMNALLAALDADQEDIALALLDYGARFDVADANGETPLMWAAFNGAQRAVRRLIQAGADVHHRSSAGTTALTDAARRGNLAIVRLLLGAGARVNDATDDGETALSLAIEHGHDAVAELLRQSGATK